MATHKLDIKRELEAVDLKDYDFYANLSDEEKKAFNPYILMRFVSNVQGDFETQAWFIEMVNECVNKNHWVLSKNHKELLWKLYAATGVGAKCYHSFLKMNKRDSVDKFEKLVADLNPAMKLSDVKLLASLMTTKERSELLDSMGFDKAQRKEYQ